MKCPKEYRKNYKKMVVEGLKCFALTAAAVLGFALLLFYAS